ncbi:hypothetical protein C8R44DRAFT_748031 [Mycena epipterygia]|nr:hypothetical protein C8R44DRAFT_748031 [Mycena epipterygia]
MDKRLTLRKKIMEPYRLPQRLSRVVILELGDIRGIALPPECVPDALVMRVGRRRRDEVEGAAHDILIEKFMRDLRRRRGARCKAVVGVGGGREPVDVCSKEGATFGYAGVEMEDDILDPGTRGNGSYIDELMGSWELEVDRGLMSHLLGAVRGWVQAPRIRAGDGSP